MQKALLTFWNLHRISILLLLASLGFYATFAYALERPDSPKLLTLWAALFFLAYKLIQFEKWNYRFLVVAGILIRLVFLLAIPNLSQDFYRFIWDGTLLLDGINPYTLTPDQFMAGGQAPFPLAETLHQGMGSLSARNFSNYPPANQYLFALAVWLGGKTLTGSLVAMRGLLLLADLGILYLGRKLLRKLNKPPHMIFWYFLNPLVVIELTGNLHFEGVMVFFLLWALYLLVQASWAWAALPLALSIGVKLMPLLLMPLLLPLLGWKRSLGLYLVTGLALAGCVYPLYFPDFGPHYLQTLKLWFSNFEFNAGMYRLAEGIAVSQGAKPWEFIAAYGRYAPWAAAGVAGLLCLHPRMREARFWFTGALAVVATYYLTAAVVHPWYLVFPLTLSLFTRFRFLLVWSALVALSYTAYEPGQVLEKPFWLFLEYFTVFALMSYELFRLRQDLFDFVKNPAVKRGD